MISAVIKYDDNKISIHTAKAKEVGEKFPSGIFLATMGKTLNIEETTFPELHKPFKSKGNKDIFETIKAFFKEGVKEKINKLGFTHKLGILLYGKQGTGKTSLLNFIANQMVIDRQAIVFLCNGQKDLVGGISLAKMIREIQDNPIIFISDEFERYASDAESEMKNFLDGVDSINNMLFLAATNYIEKVPKTLSERPSRFRVVEEVKGIEDKELMSSILKEISEKIQPNLFTEEEIKNVLIEKNNCTIDELKHIALDKVTDSFVKTKKSTLGFTTEKEEVVIADSEQTFSFIWSKAYKDSSDDPSDFDGSNI